MSNPFVAEIRIFPFNFAPTGWALCDGQLMAISQNTALFSLLGTTYGGDGKVTFALPDLQGRVPMQQGQGQGLSLRDLGEESGSDTVTLLSTEIPVHNHGFNATSNVATTASSAGNQLATASGGSKQASFTGNYLNTNSTNVTMSPNSTGINGGSQPHNNLQPYLTLNFCIALQGVFPARS